MMYYRHFCTCVAPTTLWTGWIGSLSISSAIRTLGRNGVVGDIRLLRAERRLLVPRLGFHIPQAASRTANDRASHSPIVKVYDRPEEGCERYSPGNFVTVEKTAISGQPDLQRARTS